MPLITVLFTMLQVNPEALCDTHDAIKCRCPGDGNPAASEENGPPKVRAHSPVIPCTCCSLPSALL